MQFYKMKQNGYSYKETPMTSGIVYQHMSNHYRRILTAKPAVDTSVPQSFKPRLARSVKSRRRSSPPPSRGSAPLYGVQVATSVEDLALIDRIVEISEYSPTDACRREWRSAQRKNEKLNEHLFKDISRQRNTYSNSGPKIKMKSKGGDIIDRHTNQFEAIHYQFWPRILKTDATSKLREMRVYHPPRRKSAPQWGENADGERECECREECTCGVNIGDVEGETELGKEASQASSRDSAYNGGTCSTPNSRSPTPCQQSTLSKHAATQTDPKLRRSSNHRKTIHKKMLNDDFAYTKFIHDITLDVVEKGQFTDKSLSKVIRKHVDANRSILDKKRMLEEVKKLREMLGMPANDEVDNDIADHSLKSLRKQSISRNEDIETDSWTTHYMHLSSQQSNNNSVSERTANVNIEENLDKLTNTTISSEILSVPDFEDSDSSRETTIKEVMKNGVESNDEGDDDDDPSEMDEIIESGTSVEEDIF